MTEQEGTGPAGLVPRFSWHPDYAGKRVAEVEAEITADLVHDQRALGLALDAAEQRENDALASTVALEKKWGVYDLGWAEADPAELAGRIVAFELARENAQRLFPYAEYRGTQTAPTAAPAPAADDLARPWWRRLFGA